MDKTSSASPKAGFISGQSDAITKLPKPGNATSIVIDFSKCTRGSDTVYFGLGSAHFAFEGIEGGRCIFYYGGEIENPNWNGSLPFMCKVPTRLNKETYSVKDDGILLEKLEKYCIKS